MKKMPEPKPEAIIRIKDGKVRILVKMDGILRNYKGRLDGFNMDLSQAAIETKFNDKGPMVLPPVSMVLSVEAGEILQTTSLIPKRPR